MYYYIIILKMCSFLSHNNCILLQLLIKFSIFTSTKYKKNIFEKIIITNSVNPHDSII